MGADDERGPGLRSRAKDPEGCEGRLGEGGIAKIFATVSSGRGR